MADEGALDPTPKLPKDPGTMGLTFRESMNLRDLSLGGLLFLAFCFTLYVGKPVFMPIVLALLLNFVLRPFHQRLSKHLHFPPVLASVVVLFAVIAGTLAGLYYLSTPLSMWMGRMPGQFEKIEDELLALTKPVEKVTEVAEKVDEFTKDEDDKPVVKVEEQKTSDTLWAYAMSFASTTGLVFLLLFFMLAYGEVFYKRLARTREARDMVEQVAHNVSSYLLTITLINIALGIVISVALYLLQVPNAGLWGVMATVFNFIPFLGAIAGTAVMVVVGFSTFDGTLHAAAVPATFYLLTCIEGGFVTPMILGRTFTVNPIILFIWVIAWGWLWGIAGAIIAVPLLMATRIWMENIRAFQWLVDVTSIEMPEEAAGTPDEEIDSLDDAEAPDPSAPAGA